MKRLIPFMYRFFNLKLLDILAFPSINTDRRQKRVACLSPKVKKKNLLTSTSKAHKLTHSADISTDGKNEKKKLCTCKLTSECFQTERNVKEGRLPLFC